MSTRAVQRSIGPWPLQVSVTLPAAVRSFASPLAKFPVKPGATTWQDGTGFEFCASETALKHVILAGPAIAAVAGCAPELSVVACRDCTFPRRALCALLVCAIANAIVRGSSDSSKLRNVRFIEDPRWRWIVHFSHERAMLFSSRTTRRAIARDRLDRCSGPDGRNSTRGRSLVWRAGILRWRLLLRFARGGGRSGLRS